ncbi:MAG: class I SAM-dependent methyltransferase [Bacteroidota bacterium]
MKKQKKLYPDSGVELTPVLSRYYDTILNFASFGLYRGFIRKAISDMDIQQEDDILDLGCGTGRNACLMREYLSDEGSITGVDISEKMEKQFQKKCAGFDNVSFHRKRADIPLDTGTQYDKVVVSFVIHGFPHQVRENVIANAYQLLKPGGKFIMLDFSEFSMDSMPWHHRFVFKTVECPYAFDFVERDWQNILSNAGFRAFESHEYMKNYVRLLMAEKQ